MDSRFDSSPLLVPARDGARRFGIDYDVEPYRGCPFGCLYCDSYNSLRPEEVFARAVARPDAIAAFRTELARVTPGAIIGFGYEFEPYPPQEAEQNVTRAMLEACAETGHGVVIVTKSDLVTRDADVLARIREHAPALVTLSLSTANEEVAKRLEPGAPKVADRFRTLSRLSQDGILTGVLIQPTIPFVTDTEENLLALVRRAKEVGCRFVLASFGMILSGAGRERFLDLVDREFPNLGNVFADQFGTRWSCSPRHAPALKKAFVFECRRLHLKYGMKDVVRWVRPAASIQLKLF